jgi:L-ribulose-5-phosphate 3-epimerase UlaE
METLERQGYQIIEEVYTTKEVDQLIELINEKDLNNEFGLREFLSDNLDIAKLVFNERLIRIIKGISPNCDKSIKSIYFDKPPTANWIVNWHQDLTINLEGGKQEIEEYINWRTKPERTTVQPNLELLESIFTIRIHLDDCNERNGALRVIEQSHKNGVIEIKQWNETKEGEEHICEIGKGGVLLMKPLTLHSSRRTGNNKSRRVIHIEFTEKELPEKLKWKEQIHYEKICS